MTTPRIFLALSFASSAVLGSSGCYAGAPDITTLRAAPASLAGTAIDGELRVGPDGGFVFDERARLAFDYFLTADDELEAAELAAWVRAELGRSLPAAAAEEGFAAWEAYAGFRGEAAAILAAPSADLAAVERRLLAALDEHLGDYSIAEDERGQISRGFVLARSEARTGEARERVVAGLAEVSGAGMEFVDSRREIAAAQLAGAEELEGLRRAHFGDAAAQRLAALDARRHAWASRVAALQSAREVLRAELSGAQLEVAIAELEARDFTAEELRRVHALDRLAGR